MGKSYNTFWILFILLCPAANLCPACNATLNPDSSLQIIDIESNLDNMKILNLSQLTNNIQYIPLETNETSAITWISKCDFSDSLIIMTDMQRCLLFDNKGKFISNIGRQGRGPGEFQYCLNVVFGNNKNIYIQNLYDLDEYNLEGAFVKKHKNIFRIPDNKIMRSWLNINDSLFFGHVPNATGLIEDKALIINKNGEIKNSYKNFVLFDRGWTSNSGFENHAHVYFFKNTIFYKEFYNDTLFALNDQYHLIPKYAFTLGTYKEPLSERMKTGDQRAMLKYIYLWDVFQTEKYLFLNCQLGNHFPAKRLTSKPSIIPGGNPSWINTTKALGIYDKNTKELAFCKPTDTDNPLFTSGLYNDIDAGPRFFPGQMVNDSTMMMTIKAKELKDHIASDDFKNYVPNHPEKKKQLEIFTNRLTELDNPVLMLVTFKK